MALRWNLPWKKSAWICPRHWMNSAEYWTGERERGKNCCDSNRWRKFSQKNLSHLISWPNGRIAQLDNHTRHLNFNFHRCKSEKSTLKTLGKWSWCVFFSLFSPWSSCSSNQCVFMDVVNVVFLSENRFERNDDHKKPTECKAKIKCWAINLFYECRPFRRIFIRSNIFLSPVFSVDFLGSGPKEKNLHREKVRKKRTKLSFSALRPLMFKFPCDTCQDGSSLMHTGSKYLLMYWAVRFNNNHLKTSSARRTTHQPEIIDEFDLQFKRHSVFTCCVFFIRSFVRLSRAAHNW